MGVRPSGSSPLTRGKHVAATARPARTRLIPAHAGKTSQFLADCPCGRAHPRSRGENATHGHYTQLRPGSSPLTRGKPWLRSFRSVPCRLIPAHAGKTRGTGHYRPAPAGSSPLTRGKRVRHRQVKAGSRLIPAHAGKTWTRNAQTESGEAHPRSRGENDRVGTTEGTVTGSSPLTRGKLPLFGTVPPLWRLIPAHAGKTITRLYRHGNLPAHPRSRGENYATRRDSSRPTGSSPLTRGKLSSRLSIGSKPRLIPAHAGKTTGAIDVRVGRWAHPRSRGENTVQPVAFHVIQGSSPLTRGKP